MNAAVPTYREWDSLERAFGTPPLRALFKQRPEDFCVDEILGFEPDGNGEHLLLHVEKTGLTTFDAQAVLARHFGVALRDTAFSGMKDKQGVTRQWFSVPARRDVDAQTLQHPGLDVLSSARNSRKLRRGSHKGNRFRIVLRNAIGDRDAALERIATIAARGVPNYFGAQRFGRGEANVPAALAWFRGETNPARPQRSLLLSAARSYLFNAYLAGRVHDGNWERWIDGEVMALAGSASTFASTRASAEELVRRLDAFDIHPTGPLWGKGGPATSSQALAQENVLAVEFPELCNGLALHGLEQERRPLRLQASDLQAQFDGDALILEFSLTRGAYATALLRELLQPGCI
ncbi:MAG: tRNA pseudouridine(13) synthase TruD [Pseudomonadota bacterium]|nr:tRNA pseudouridine(13) synthase TruD [Pseudomonadota bacterium]